jgi:hypothetical protein
MRKQTCRPADRVSVLGCQLLPANSFVEAAVCAAGTSLPGMSLAFALMAAINGSHRLQRHTVLRPRRDQASPASAQRLRDSHSSGVAAQAASDTVLQIRADHVGGARMRCNGPTRCRGPADVARSAHGLRAEGAVVPLPLCDFHASRIYRTATDRGRSHVARDCTRRCWQMSDRPGSSSVAATLRSVRRLRGWWSSQSSLTRVRLFFVRLDRMRSKGVSHR